MALNLGSTGDFLPFLSYNAKAGRYHLNANQVKTEVVNPTFIADLENIKTGWLYYREGAAPEKVFDKSLSEAAPMPERTYVDKQGKTQNCFKRGFEVVLFSKALFNGAVEFSSSSNIVGSAINDLYIQFEKDRGANAGKVPVVESKGTEEVKGSYGTNYKPMLSIVKWVDRPAELSGGTKSAPVVAATPEPVQASSVSEF